MWQTVRWVIGVTSALILQMAGAQAADATSCKPLQLINSIKMKTSADRSRYYVPVSINGTPKTLVLDTGGGMTQLTEGVVRELKLEEVSSALTARDLAGHVSSKAVRVGTFDLGNQRGENLEFHVAPMPILTDDAVGLLSSDLFLQYDIDLDFGAERLNYFSQDHCEGRVTYWPERPLAVVPVDLRDGHLNLDVTLDGKAFHAVLDTGAPITTTAVADAIVAFDLKRGSPELPVIGQDKDDPYLKIYSHNFERLSFGDITVIHPQINLISSKYQTFGFNLDPQLRKIIIGMNVLKQLHLYIAYGEKKLYITPAGTGESALVKATASNPP